MNSPYELGRIYSPTSSQAEELRSGMASIKGRFARSVQDMLEKQGRQLPPEPGSSAEAESVDAAPRALSREEGYWGAEQTAGRILTFAKALVGSDPGRGEEMRRAFLLGCEGAAQAAGGTLSPMAEQTRERAMELFDAWVEGKSPETVIERS